MQQSLSVSLSLSLSVHMSSSSLSLSCPVFLLFWFWSAFFFCPDLLRFSYYVYNNYMLYMWNMIKQELDGWMDGVVSGRTEPTNLEENNVLLRTGTLSFSFTRFTSTKKLSVCFVSSQLIWETEKDRLFIPNLTKRETDTERKRGTKTDMQTDSETERRTDRQWQNDRRWSNFNIHKTATLAFTNLETSPAGDWKCSGWTLTALSSLWLRGVVQFSPFFTTGIWTSFDVNCRRKYSTVG